MFSIKIDNDIVKEIKEIDISNIMPHEKVLLDKKEVLKEYKSFLLFNIKFTAYFFFLF